MNTSKLSDAQLKLFNGENLFPLVQRFLQAWDDSKAATLQQEYQYWDVSTDPETDNVKLIIGYNNQSNTVAGWVFYLKNGDRPGSYDDVETIGATSSIINNLVHAGKNRLAGVLKNADPTYGYD